MDQNKAHERPKSGHNTMNGASYMYLSLSPPTFRLFPLLMMEPDC